MKGSSPASMLDRSSSTFQRLCQTYKAFEISEPGFANLVTDVWSGDEHRGRRGISETVSLVSSASDGSGRGAQRRLNAMVRVSGWAGTFVDAENNSRHLAVVSGAPDKLPHYLLGICVKNALAVNDLAEWDEFSVLAFGWRFVSNWRQITDHCCRIY